MPSHHKGGWHLTGTLGSVASSIGAAKMLGLSAPHTLMALGIGCTQASGLQQNRGSDCKSLHAGKSAYHGVLAAGLASDGYNSSSEILEGSLGFTRVYSTNQNLESITHELGKNWQINNNGYKPYSCGVVLHPLIDASIALSQKAQVGADDIAQFEILVHPDVIRITGVDQPGSGLMSKFSANHAAAVSFIDRAGGVNQFTNEKAQNSEVMGLRKLVNIVPSTHLELDQAQATLIKKSGEQVQVRIEHAKGTVQNPMSDEDIQGKFIQNASSCIGPAQIQQISNLVWRLEQLNDLNSLTSLLS
jgi:2-methylcitrate dehydratase PrpD